MLRPALLIPFCAMVLLAEPNRPAASKIQRGFSALSNGSWESAFKEWNEDGAVPQPRLDEIRQKLTKLGLEGRTIGDFSGFHPPILQQHWQRHWVVATFDTGAAFFSFDFMGHKGEWRLFRVEVAAQPQEVLPSVDLLSLPVRIQER